MNFFEEHKALIITLLIFSILLLSMYNINISNSNKKVRETLIELNNMKLEQPKEEQKPEEEQPAPSESRKPNLQTHQAFNQDRENQEDLQSRLDEIFEKNAAQQEASEDETAESKTGEFNVPISQKEKPQRASQGNNTTPQTSTMPGSLRGSSISFSLVGRTAVSIPNPVYTCDRGGKVVININVNSNGDVVKTSVNKAASSTSNQCLIDRALEYAAGAIFSKMPSRSDQLGTITYYFQN